MAISADVEERPQARERPLDHLRATPEERERILSAIEPFDTEAWMREVRPATPEEMEALEEFLHEREEARRQSLERERLA
jgi:hypothetical protein